MLNNILIRLVDADKVGGYVRAAVASLFGLMLAKWSWLGTILSPEVQTAVAIALSGVAVGAWSHFAKTVASK